jgi:hypothetical protein
MNIVRIECAVNGCGGCYIRPGISRRRGSGGLPSALADRTGVQAVEIAPAHRRTANKDRSRYTMLALCSPDRGTAR